MTTQGDKATATVKAEYVGREVLGKLLGICPSTVTNYINKWRAAGKDVPKLGRNFHLESVRQAALEAARQSY